MKTVKIPNSQHPEYNAWRGMRARCQSPKAPNYNYYGARGIQVHPSWENFEQFLKDMGSRPGPEYTLDRYPDPYGHYEPGNVRWATKKQQMNNLTTNRRIRWNGESLTASQWSERSGVPGPVIYLRHFRYGWGEEEAITQPVRAKKAADRNDWATGTGRSQHQRHSQILSFAGRNLSLSDWGACLGLNPETIRKRLTSGMTPYEALLKAPYKQSNKKQSWKGEEERSQKGHTLTYAGETLALWEWARLYGLRRNVLYNRIFVYRKPIEKALTELTQTEEMELPSWVSRVVLGSDGKPISLITFEGEEHSLQEWAAILNIRPVTLLARLKAGKSVEEALTEPLAPTQSYLRPLQEIRVRSSFHVAEGLFVEEVRQQGKPGRPIQMLTYKGIRKATKEWARDLGITPEGLRHRVKNGWPLERVFGF